MSKKEIIAQANIEHKIYNFRERKVMIDRDLAQLYQVKTKELNKAVKRNTIRFPSDFMFQLTDPEAKILRSQIGTSKNEHGGRRYLPYVFTEQGVAMLSSVLHSKRAVLVNIEIMRTFARLREMIISHKDLQNKINEMEKKYDRNFSVVFKALRELLAKPENDKPIKKIGIQGND